ncbi:MAG: chemotaxis protein CheD [Firmicutes bacterium]|nr:chemotaxis protein CheD [Bacillota bacterium]
MADARAVTGSDSLRTVGLGSCVGVALYDARAAVAGLAHIMLPDSRGDAGATPAKYADSGIALLLQLMQAQGAKRNQIVAKLAGGAQMFTVAGRKDYARIGPRNVEAVEAVLVSARIPVVSRAVGGHKGRTIELYAQDGSLTVRCADVQAITI